MSEPTVEALSERERACLDHLKQAQDLGVSFAEYCRSFELNVTEWYPIKQALTRKGVISGRSKTEEEERPAGFAPVRIVPSTSSNPAACRIRHPSGWTIELPALPESAWLKDLMAGELA